MLLAYERPLCAKGRHSRKVGFWRDRAIPTGSAKCRLIGEDRKWLAHRLADANDPDSDIQGATILLRKPVMVADQVFPGKAFV
jgi:hypothetical protein